ncbi:hypothetical protein AB3538_09830 [Acinetobacter baumannii]
MLLTLLDALYQENHLELISILAEQLSEGRVRQVEILVDSRPGSILSSSEQPATTTAALQTAPIPQPAKVKREPNLLLILRLVLRVQKRNY